MPPNRQSVHGGGGLVTPMAAAAPSSKVSASVCTPLNLQLIDVAYRVKEERTAAPAKEPPGRISHSGGGGVLAAVEKRTILKGTTGEARPGGVLAVLGPSGSGKSTLLSVLSGRFAGRYSGTVLTGGRSPCRAVQRRTGFVAQDDILHPHLTVRETLAFCTMLRLPTSAPTSAKLAAADAGAEVLEAVTSVFQLGKLAVEAIQVDENAAPTPPIPVLIVAPKDAGTYPVAMLLHGFFLHNHFYEHLLQHVASHGFIVVAPQFSISIIPSGDAEDIAAAAKVADWLPDGLPSVLPKGVEPELSKLALAGHSRGGHTAFSLALGHAKTQLTFSALIGLDPVAGTGKSSQLQPKILTYEPSSFDMAMPVLVIGTGLGEEKKNIFFPPCAPKDVNHAEFYRECRPPSYYFVTKDYGHLDMLDDDAPKFITCVCKDGNGCKDKMRRCVAGIMVAFLNAALGEKDGDLEAILRDPAVAPTTLDPVEHHLA